MLPHEIPAGADVITPDPVPVGVTHRLTFVVGVKVKVAVQLEVATMTSCALASVPLQLPDQPVKVEPVSGVAVNVTAELAAKPYVQMLPHEMPAGADVITPEPVPALLVVRLTVLTVGGGAAAGAVARANVAVHVDLFASTKVVVAAVPVQIPDQPLKTDPASAVAVSETFLVNQ